MKTTIHNPRLRQLIVLSLCAVLLGIVASPDSAEAQPQQRGKQGDIGARLDHMMAEMTKTLSLTEAQQTNIRAILEDREEEMKAMRGSSGERQRPDMEKMKAVMDKFDEQIEAELTEKQIPLYQKMREEGKQSRQNGNPRLERRGSDKRG